MIRITPVLSIALAMSLGSTCPADAQLIPGRPFRPLFRTTHDPASSPDRVDVSVFLAGGYDEAGTSRATDPADPRLSRASYGSLFATGLYAHEGRRFRFTLMGGGTSRYYSTLETLTVMNLFAGAHVTAPVGRRSELMLAQRVNHSAYYAFRPSTVVVASEDAPDEAAGAEGMPEFDAETDHRTVRRNTSTYDSFFHLRSRTGRDSRIDVGYAFRYADTNGEAFDLVSHRPTVRYTQTVGRYTAVSVGYGLNAVAYVDASFRPLVSHDIRGGVTYARPLPFSRDTSVSLATWTSIVLAEDSRRYYVGGIASLAHKVTRDWTAALTYRRGVDVLEGFAVPFFTFVDSVSAGVRGRLVGPLRLATSATYGRGTFSVRSSQNAFDSRSASVRLLVPVASMLATYVEGYYSNYDFQGRIGLLPTTPTAVERYGARAGLTFWLPVLR